MRIGSLADIVAMVGDARLDIRAGDREAPPRTRETSVTALDAAPLPARNPFPQGKPYARSIIYFPPAVGSRLSRRVFDDAVVFRVLQRELGIHIEDVR